MRAIRRGRHEAPRLMACLLQLAPACSRVETFVGFGWETPRVFANPLTELTCHKSRRSIDSANRAPVGRRLFCVLLGSAVLLGCGYSWLLATSGRCAKLVVLRFSSPRNYRFGGHRCYISSQYGIKRVTTDATDVICGIKFGLCQTINLLSVKRLSAYV